MERRLADGTLFGRYRISRLLGAGGAGQVYAADDTVIHRPVALKIWKDAGVTQTLVHEARLLGSLRHPHIVGVFDAGAIDGIPFLAMELLEGRSLRSCIGDGSIPIEQRLAWLEQMASALDATHARGLVHRDVKPDNVFVSDREGAKLLDFGIAKRALEPTATADTSAPPSTATGHVRGTLRYMAPEQIAGVATDARTDQYAWGLVAYELLSGAHPSQSGGALLSQVDPRIPFPVAAAIGRALAQRPSERFGSMGELSSAFRSTTAPPPYASTATMQPYPTASPPPRSSGRTWIVVSMVLALVTVSAVTVAVVLVLQSRSTPPVVVTASAAPSPSVTVTAPPSVVASTPAPPSASASVAARPPPTVRPTGPVSTSCVCFTPSQPAALCRSDAYSASARCQCNTADGFHLCLKPWQPDATGTVRCADDVFRGEKDGDVCRGYQNADKPISSGTLSSCTHCPSHAYFTGRTGDPCRGVDESRRSFDGKLTCR